MEDAPEHDDDALLRAWRDGDAQAGEALFDRHAPAVARFFSNKVDDAVELLQATFLRMLDGRERLRRGSAFRAYALASARAVLTKHLRSLARDLMFDPEVDSIAALTRRPSSALGEREEHRVLLEGLRRLPIDDQIIIELFYWEGLDSRTVGEVVGMPAPSVRTRLRRARQQLRRIMAELSAEPSALRRAVEGLDQWAAEVRQHLSSDLEPPRSRSR